MKRKQLLAEGALLLCALIWGMAFVAQSVATDYVDAFTFQAARSILAGVVLLPLVWLSVRNDEKVGIRKHPWMDVKGGVLCGLFLTAGSLLQQIGIKYTTAGKAGFLTSLYLVIVAVFCVILGKKLEKKLIVGIILAVTGIYLMSGASGFSFAPADLLLLMCSVFFAVQIMIVDHYVTTCNPIRLSCVQFFTSAVISGILMLVFEHPSIQMIRTAAIPILYAGIFSSGVAYTLQIVGQKHAKPAMATLLMSFESVFSMIGGILLLHQIPATRELIGCILMFAAVLLSQMSQEQEATL